MGEAQGVVVAQLRAVYPNFEDRQSKTATKTAKGFLGLAVFNRQKRRNSKMRMHLCHSQVPEKPAS